MKGPTDVFLNVPFDQRYERIFVALVAGIVGVGARPHCVLEIPDGGQGRLRRIWDLIRSCPVSIHDLSRVSRSGPMRVPRFNMPFELGLACGASFTKKHDYFVLEERDYRLQQSLSDLNLVDPRIHGGTVKGALRAVLQCLRRPGGGVTVHKLLPLDRRLAKAAKRLKADHSATSVFDPVVFTDLVLVAVELARTPPMSPAT